LGNLFTTTRPYIFIIIDFKKPCQIYKHIAFCNADNLDELNRICEIFEPYIFNLRICTETRKRFTDFSGFQIYKPPELFISDQILLKNSIEWKKTIQHIIIYLIFCTIASHINVENDRTYLNFAHSNIRVSIESPNSSSFCINDKCYQINDLWNDTIELYLRFLSHPDNLTSRTIQTNLKEPLSDLDNFLHKFKKMIFEIGPRIIPVELPCYNIKIQIATVQLQLDFGELLTRKNDKVGLYSEWNSEKLEPYRIKILRILDEIKEEHNPEYPLIIIFPELSIPPDIIEDLESFSKKNRAIIIGGSHYHQKLRLGKKINVNISPIIYPSHNIHEDSITIYTEKIFPAYFEEGVRKEDRIERGDIVYYLVCSGYNILITICNDFLNLYSVYSEQLLNKTSLIICLRASTKTDEFDRLSESLKQKFIVFASLTGKLPKNQIALGKTSIWGDLDYYYRHESIAKKGTYERELESLADNQEGFIIATIDLSQTTTISKPVDYHRSQCGYVFDKKMTVVKINSDFKFISLPDQLTERIHNLKETSGS
ncbi:MAG: hypothetical protein ACFFAU_20810, partial [Candidatus Hodarchaeota archaeon]